MYCVARSSLGLVEPLLQLRGAIMNRSSRTTLSLWLLIGVACGGGGPPIEGRIDTVTSDVDTQVSEVSFLGRGFNLNQLHAYDQAFYDDLARHNVNLVRFSFANNNLISRWPNGGVFHYNEGSFALMHQNIQMARTAGLRVIIDPHSVVGGKNAYTSLGSDKIWRNPFYRNAWIDLWGRIAHECQAYGDTLFAYDILNEPPSNRHLTAPNITIRPNDLFKVAVERIRQHDTTHNIVLNFHHEDFEDGLVKSPSFYGGDTANGSVLLLGPHVYWPLAYTHQGLHDHPPGRVWPHDGGLEPTWNRAHLEAEYGGFFRYLAIHGAHRGFIGEWGLGPDSWNEDVANPSAGGRTWIGDVARMLKEVHWTAHTFGNARYGGYSGFDLDQPPSRWRFFKNQVIRPHDD